MLTQLIDVTNVPLNWTSDPIPTNISGPRATLYIMNVSNLTYFLDFGNGQVAHIPAYWARPFCLPSTIRWITFSIAKAPIGMPNPPFSHIAIETYMLSEDTSNLANTSINAQVSVQGNTSVNTTTAQAIQNDGNTPGTIIVESTPNGASDSQVVLTNNGEMTLGDPTTQGGSLTVNGSTFLGTTGVFGELTLGQDLLFSGVATIGAGGTVGNVLSANVSNTHINANAGTVNIDVAGVTQISMSGAGIAFSGNAGLGQGGSTSNVIAASNTNTHVQAPGGVLFDINGTNIAGVNAGGLYFAGVASIGQGGSNNNSFSANAVNTHINATGGSVNFDVNGTTQAFVNGNGLNLNVGGVHFVTGSFTRVSSFTGTATNTYNHGLGVTPDIVIPMTDQAGSQTMGYDSANSTTVHITSPSSLNFKAIAIKF